MNACQNNHPLTASKPAKYSSAAKIPEGRPWYLKTRSQAVLAASKSIQTLDV